MVSVGAVRPVEILRRTRLERGDSRRYFMNGRTEKTKRMVTLSILAAVIVVLQVAATFIKVGPFAITLALVPIVVAAAIYGPSAGAVMGGVFGVVTLFMCVVGADAGGAILWNVNPICTALLCLLKGAAAGWVSGLIYKVLGKKSIVAGAVTASIASPIVNTGIFLAAMATIYHTTLVEWAGGADVVYYVFIGLVGVNFLVEFLVNVVLSSVIVSVIKAVRRSN